MMHMHKILIPTFRKDHYPNGIEAINIKVKTEVYVAIISPGKFYDQTRKFNESLMNLGKSTMVLQRERNIIKIIINFLWFLWSSGEGVDIKYLDQ